MCVQRCACRVLPGRIWPVVMRGHPLRLYMDGRPLVPLVISRMLILLEMLWTPPEPLLPRLMVTGLLALCASKFLVRVHVHEFHTDLLYLLGELIPTMARDQFAKYCPFCSLGSWLLAFISVTEAATCRIISLISLSSPLVTMADFPPGSRCCWPEVEGVCLDGVSFGEDLKSLTSDSETSSSTSFSVEVGRGTFPKLMLPVINKWSLRKPKLRVIHCSLSVCTFGPAQTSCWSTSRT